jgi:hypothetical protein
MANKPTATWLIDEVADFLAACPSGEELLAYRPSRQAQERFNALLEKSKKGTLNAEEEWELNQFEHLEVLMQAVKARLRRSPGDGPSAILAARRFP